MELVEQLQKLAPWAADLPILPKVILSLIIAAIAALFLAVIWTTPTTTQKQSLNALKEILDGCYRRAVFTRTHAQMDQEAMFASVRECRQLVQSKAPKVATAELRQHVATLLAAFDGIEREHGKQPRDFSRIDGYKLEALRRLTLLSRLTGLLYVLPENLTEEVFFSKIDADLPPTVQSTRPS